MHSRTIRSMAFVMLAAAVVAGPQPAQGAAPTCQGQEATIVGTEGSVTKGPSGTDVIVAGSNAHVMAYEGDDKVCVLSGFVDGGGGHDSVTVNGGAGRDLAGFLAAEDLDASLGPGDDEAILHRGGSGPGSGSIDGGSGDDLIKVFARRDVAVHLEGEYLTVDRSRNYSLASFRDVLVTAKREIQVTGDGRANTILVGRVVCSGFVQGLGGDDHIEISGRFDSPPTSDCRESQTPRLYGMRGNDRLQGSGRNDVLNGGPGWDVAKGSRGIDKCLAERKRNCER